MTYHENKFVKMRTFQLLGSESHKFLANRYQRLHEFELGRQTRRIAHALKLSEATRLRRRRRVRRRLFATATAATTATTSGRIGRRSV